MDMDADVIVVGAGLAGLVAAGELADAGRRVIVLDQEPEASLGGQAFWSFGGLFLVDTPEQRRLGIRDSAALAMQDWMGSAGFDRAEDYWPRRWAEAYVRFAAGEKRRWLHGLGVAPLIDAVALEATVRARDRQVENPFGKDAQVTAIRGARAYLADRLVRVARPHPILDPAAGPLVAVRLWILTRKTLGGLETDLQGRVLRADGQPLPGLYAAGEAAGFGGGMHGYRALEGTFLGGCLFSGRVAGRSAAAAT